MSEQPAAPLLPFAPKIGQRKRRRSTSEDDDGNAGWDTEEDGGAGDPGVEPRADSKRRKKFKRAETGDSPRGKRRVHSERQLHSKDQVATMMEWLLAHWDDPYASPGVKGLLSRKTGLTLKQVCLGHLRENIGCRRRHCLTLTWLFLSMSALAVSLFGILGNVAGV